MNTVKDLEAIELNPQLTKLQVKESVDFGDGYLEIRFSDGERDDYFILTPASLYKLIKAGLSLQHPV